MERKVATVLFADLVGSTQLGEQDPERTRVLLDRFYDAMREEVERAGGTVEKFAGDAVMAAFGAPAALEDHAERALHVALAMQRRIEDQFANRLELRIGVNTGEVVVDPQASSSFVTGDAVNVCARLEENAEPGEILVGERTAMAAHGAFEFGRLRRLEAKGKSEPVGCHALVRAVAATRPRGVAELPQRFVGRVRELETLCTAYDRACDTREPELVLVVGDAGVGKSRLVQALWDWLRQLSFHTERWAGRCLSYGEGITYWPIREILQDHPAAVADAPILGLALGHDVAPHLHPLAARDRLREAWVELLTKTASEDPLVVLVEDVHWADEALLELLEQSVRNVRGPLLIVATARPDVRWSGGRRNVTILELDPLPDEDAKQMVADFPEAVRTFLIERAEGNPFFVEELTRSLIDRGILVRRNGGWEARDLEHGVSLPDSIRGVLAARIDLLPAREKAALQAGALIGRVFWDGPVRELIAGDADFGVLVEREFVQRRRESAIPRQLEYAIKHALTREVAYASVPKAGRARLHAAFASWLEQLEERDEIAALLAHHYAEAVRPEDVDLAWSGQEDELGRLRRKAVEWLRRAGTSAVRRYEIEDGVALLERAAELEEDADACSELWRQIGFANALRFAGDAFVSAMQRALEMSGDPKARADTYSVLAFQTSIRSGMWAVRPSDNVFNEWVDRALELAQPASAARARALIARANWSPQDAADAGREGSALADELGDPELRSYAWAARSTVAFDGGEFAAAAEWACRRFDLEPEITDPDHLVELRETAAPAVAAVVRLREARRFAAEHLELSRTLTPHHRVHGVALVAEMNELAGDWGAITEAESEIIERVKANLETPCIRNSRTLLLAAVARAAGGDAAGSGELEQLAEEVRTAGYDAPLIAARLRLALLRGDLGDVERLAAPSARHRLTFGLPFIAVTLDAFAALRRRDVVEDLAPRYMQPRTYLEPFAQRAVGIVREHDELVSGADDRFRALGLDWYAAQTPALLRT